MDISLIKWLNSTFFSRRRHTGSPLKASKMTRSLMNELEDPRRKEDQQRGATGLLRAHVYNTTVAYTLATGRDLGRRYMEPKANLQAAMEDHSYLGRPHCEY